MAGQVIIEAAAKHTSTIIFLHGLGDTGNGWADSIKRIRPAHAKVICPTAATMPVTLNAGYSMPSWFDLKSLDDSQKEDEQGIHRARDHVHSLIDDHLAASGLSSERVLLGGFSQGGALALYSALTYSRTLAGVMALSCWLPLRQEFPGCCHQLNRSIPILQCHGDCDPLVLHQWGQTTATTIRKFAPMIEFKSYQKLEHSSCEQELEDMKQFAARVLPAQ